VHPLYDVLYRRRDTRREFTGEPIDPAVLDRVLRAAHAAPSVGLSQPWDFILVSDDTCAGSSAITCWPSARCSTPPSIPSAPPCSTGSKIEGVLESSLGVVVCYDPGAARRPC